MELIIAIAILSLIIGFGVPSYLHLMERHHLRNITKTLFEDLTYAKNYANRHRTRVSICKTDDGRSCANFLHHDWRTGWIVFKDPLADFSPSESDLLRVNRFDHLPKSLTIRTNKNIGNGLNINQFRRYGRSLGSGLPNGSIEICIGERKGERIVINLFGESRLEPSPYSCIS